MPLETEGTRFNWDGLRSEDFRRTREAVLLLEPVEATEEWLGDRPIALQSLCEEEWKTSVRSVEHTARLNTHASDIDGQLWQVFEREYRPVLEEALEEFEGVPTGMKRMDFGSDGEWKAYQCDRGLTQWVEGVTACLEQGAGCPYGPRFSMSNGPVFGIKFPGVYLPEECVAASRWQQDLKTPAIAIRDPSEVDAVWMEEAVDLALLLDWIEELEEPCGFTGNLPNETSWTVAEQAWQEALDAWRSRMVSPEDAGQWNPSNVRIRPADGNIDGVVRYATESSAGRIASRTPSSAPDALRSLGNWRMKSSVWL